MASRRGNPPGSIWRSTPNAKRHRVNIKLTLSPEEIAEAEELGDLWGEKSKSATFGRAVHECLASEKRKKEGEKLCNTSI